ncbi:MAG TPA: RpoL/Rpb11 RNA polymerase subunit family protein [Nitrososphaeraceae archaeon]|jgi:DNA-directed RNA polymerase subunit L|nr:RpoL/Rpb11 RNA polymerase subunit family protein [Nitrososphaeraceae archaeon]
MWYDLYPKYVLDYLMQAEITNYTNNEIELKLKDEDISIMYIIQHHILKQKNIEFAGIVMKHPLIKEYLMRINSQVNPMDVLEKSVKSADEFLQDLSNSFESSLQKVA